jgi:hypothetical protein
MTLIDRILQSEEFTSQPPVLIDIGASGEINKKWQPIARYSLCLAFDADDRDFQVSEKTDSGYKKLVTFNRIVTAENQQASRFYLTRSPYCSSLLKPDAGKLEPWLFSDLFKVEKETTLASVTIDAALQTAGINYIDWFKTDTQGTDLRLFKSLPASIKINILAAEFEPGIIDAYEGEDKLYSVMQEMHQQNFWASSMIIKGNQRLKKEYSRLLSPAALKRTLRISPGWAEVSYIREPFAGSKRQLMLLLVFALIEKQYGYALEIADYAQDQLQNGSFEKWKKEILQKIKGENWKIPLIVAKRQFNKLLSGIND